MAAGPADDERAPTWGVATIALLTLVWLGATPVVALGSVMDLWTFLGEVPTAADHSRAQQHAVIATVLAAGCPAVAWYLSARWHRRTARVVFGVGAVLGLVGGLVLYGLVSPHTPDVPVRDEGPPVCQERSGGDTDCPGG